jgi:hypothetical protein
MPSATSSRTGPTGAAGTPYPPDGWTAIAQTLAYSSVDGPTGVVAVTGADLTGVIPVGARLKFTQTTVKYFIVTAVAFAGGNTTITFYGGTDYALVNATITFPSYSLMKVPFGFNADPAKWTEMLVDSGVHSQTSPATGTWYNVGSLSLALPIGAWNVDYACNVGFTAVTVSEGVYVSLSTSSSSETDTSLSAGFYDPVAGNVFMGIPLTRRKFITVTVKTVYYLIFKVDNAGSTTLYGASTATNPTIIRAICAYL